MFDIAEFCISAFNLIWHKFGFVKIPMTAPLILFDQGCNGKISLQFDSGPGRSTDPDKVFISINKSFSDNFSLV